MRMNCLRLTLLSSLCLLIGACGEPSSDTVDAVVPADALATCSTVNSPLSSQRLTVLGTTFLDASDRHVLLRGVNVGGRSKFAPFFPFPFQESGLDNQKEALPFNEAVADFYGRVASWGHNVVRMPFSWEALEPVRGAYDDVYLSRYLAMIDAAGEHGIRVLVDFHQDVFAAPYCGDGFPLWACPEPLPEPPEDCSGWFMGYLDQTSPINAAYGRFWRNEDGLQDSFKAMWKHMAKAAWSRDNVIGFEIMNEPHHGTEDEEAWAQNILPSFYEDVGKDIRSVAPNALIFFDSTGLDAATQEPLLKRPEGNEFVFAPHYYLMSIYTGGELDMEEVPKGLARWAAKGSIWALPVFVGEFGIYRDLPEAEQYFTVIMNALDSHFLNGTAWEVSTTQDDWNDEGMSLIAPDGQETDGLRALIRVYPSAIAGEAIAFQYGPTARVATLTYNAKEDGLTELVVPPQLYSEGVEISVAGVGACATHVPAESRVVIRTQVAGEVTVTLKPLL
jgi:endoglycosylceramidase